MGTATDSVKKRILGLMAKTTENGCTEEEALAASAKVQQMLHDYQLDLSDLEIAESKCVEGTYDTEVKSRQPVMGCVTAIGYFTDTKCWFQSDGEFGHLAFKYFGLEHDVMIAEYITKICDWAIIWGGEDFKSTRYYMEASRSQRSKLKASFQQGMAARLAKRLRAMKDEQQRKDIETTGRDLVVVKNAVVEDEWAKKGLTLSKGRKYGGKVDPYAYAAGQAEGDKVALNPGVGAGSGPAGELT